MKRRSAAAAMLAATAAFGVAAAEEPRLVEGKPGYNSWPMVQAVRGRLVCAYSSGKKHSICDGERCSFARWSADGGATWSAAAPVAASKEYGEVPIGKGLDADGAMLLWIRRFGGRDPRHDLFRTADGEKFELVHSARLDPLPVQITDVFAVPGKGLMALWFAGSYTKDGEGSWGTLESADNGKTWKQTTVEKGLSRREWPTEPSAVYLGGGKILAIGRTEGGPAQFQLTSEDGGKTWKKVRTNIKDVLSSTPSLILDPETGVVSNYYYWRGKRSLRRRTADAAKVFADPTAWSEPVEVARGNENVPWDAGNANAAALGGKHYVAYYTGESSADTSVYVVPAEAPGK